MKSKDLLSVFKRAFYDFGRNPLIVLPGLILFGVFILFSKLAVQVNYKLQSTMSLILWLVIFTAVSFLIMSYLFSSLIGMSKKSTKGKTTLNDFFFYGKKYLFRNFSILFAFLVLYLLIVGSLFVFTKFMISISGVLTVPENGFKFLSLLIVVAWLLGVIIFFTFSNFYLIIRDISVGKSIIMSRKLVKREYINVLIISVFFFVLFSVLNLFSGIFRDLIGFLVLTPYMSLVLTRFILEFD
jgi:hypothetical protein